MSGPSLVSSLFWNWGNSLAPYAKFITSVVVGALGTAVTVQRNLREIRESHSTPARTLANKKVAELIDMLTKVPPGEPFSAWRKELELQVSQSLKELDALRAKESELAKEANRDLTLLQRLFVLFPPRDPSIWIVHALAYAFMTAGSVIVLMLVLFCVVDDVHIGDVMVVVVFGALAFRAWALAERKWATESLKRADGSDPVIPPESSPLQALLVLRKSRSWKMLVAQICMWTCLFCAVESLEDIFVAALDASKAATQGKQPGALANASTPGRQMPDVSDATKKARADAENGLLLFLTSLLGAVICRAWAAGEWRHGSPPVHSGFTKAIFPAPKLRTATAWLLTGIYVAAMPVLIVSVVAWPVIFNDALDRTEFVFVWLAVCVACNRLLSFLGYAAYISEKNKSSTLAQSTSVSG
jgi:hypothetical protein